MKFAADRSLFSEACQNTARAVSSKSTLPALEGLLISAADGKLIISGYDLEMGIVTELPADVTAGGEIVLNARLLCDILRSLPEENVFFECDSKWMTVIKSGHAEFSIMGIDAAEFPALPSFEGAEGTDNFMIESEKLAGMIRQTVFAVSQTDIKPVLTGILFELSGGSLQMVALDGYRLAMRKESILSDISVKFIVPGKTISEIAKLLSSAEEGTQVIIGSRHITFRIGSYYVVSRLLEGSFIDYNSAIPKESTAEVLVSARAFMNCVERISPIITDRLKSPVRCLFNERSVMASCATTIGRANDEFSCKGSEGLNLEMGFNNKYLLDALKACDDEEVKIQLSSSLSPMKIVPVDGDGFLLLVLPVRLKAE